jgi:hypothetical protein
MAAGLEAPRSRKREAEALMEQVGWDFTVKKERKKPLPGGRGEVGCSPNVS